MATGRGWKALVWAVTVSVLGDVLSSVAIASYLLERHGAGWVAAYFVAALGMRTVVSPIGGWLADRADVVRLLVAADVGRVAVFVAAAMAMAFAAPAAVLLGATTVAAMLGGVHRPAFASLVPRLVADERLETANAAVATAHQVGWVTGPAVGAVVALLWRAEVAVLLNAATFIAAALITATVRPGPRGAAADVGAVPGDAAAPRSGPARSLVRALAVPLIAGAGLMIVFGAEHVLHPVLVRDSWQLEPAVAGMLVTAAGLGGLVGASLAARAARRLGPLRGTCVAVAASLAAFGGLAWMPSLGFGMVLCAIGGAFGVLYDVASITLVQRAVPRPELGRAAGIVELVDGSAQLCGLVLVPLLLQLAGVRVVVTVLALAATALLLLAISLSERVATPSSIVLERSTTGGGDDHDLQHHPAGPPAHQDLIVL